MKVLLDTQVFLWAITDDLKLSNSHRELWLNSESELQLSTASMWEMLLKTALGKLPLPVPAADLLFRQAEANRVSILPIRKSHLIELESLPPLHRDPFDRMIVAQARAEGIPIATVDHALRKYDINFA